ncbi:MAG: hypothetical protein ACTSYT_03150 [Candidatus Asgardarchaeia archaeon]
MNSVYVLGELERSREVPSWNSSLQYVLKCKCLRLEGKEGSSKVKVHSEKNLAVIPVNPTM